MAHLKDGNLHFAVFPSRDDPAYLDMVRQAVEDVVAGLGGGLSAEHGIGPSKKATMARRKNPVAPGVMGQIKKALDPRTS